MDQAEFAITGETLIWGVVRLVIGVVVSSGWYWLGARIFRCQPTYTNCLIAAIIPPVVMFFLQILAAIIVAFFACISIYLGLLVLLVAVVYLLVLYVRWVRDILEIESTGVAFLLVVLPIVAQVILGLALRES